MGEDSPSKLEKALFNVPPKELMASPSGQVFLEQYKSYLEYIDKVSERRQNANSFFLSLNTGVCALLGYIFSKDSAPELKSLIWVLPIAGIFLSYFWYRLVTSYSQLNSGKFAVLHLMEKYLPAAPYRAEWVAMGEGKDKSLYTPLTHLEIWIPRLFILMYLVLMIYWIKVL